MTGTADIYRDLVIHKASHLLITALYELHPLLGLCFSVQQLLKADIM